MSRQTQGDRDHRQRLLDRFIKTGLASFADYEILELVLTLAIPRGDVTGPARELIAKFKDLRGILDAPVEEVQAIRGMPSAMPIALRIVREVATVYLRGCAEQQACLLDEDSLLRFWRMRIGALQREVFEVGYLDSGYRLLRDGVEEMARGTTNRTAVYPRIVMEGALRRGAAALVFAHNHPNGKVAPSDHDKALTRSLVLAAETLQIKVLDHLIISTDDVFSFRKAGLL